MVSPMAKITQEKRGHLMLIGFDRPEKMNAFDMDMLGELSAAFTELERDEEARCAVVFANGDHFTAGLDLANVAPVVMEGKMPFATDGIDPWGVHGKQRSKPAVAAVHGRCLTLGIELCLAMDVVVAATSTRFGQIEIKRGFFRSAGRRSGSCRRPAGRTRCAGCSPATSSAPRRLIESGSFRR